MKVLLVANYKPDGQASMARYASLLSQQLRQSGHDVETISPDPVMTGLVGRNNPLFHWLGYIDKFVLFPPVLRRLSRSADLVHICDHSNSFYLRWTGKTPNLITAHDALAIRSALGDFPENPTRWSGVRLQRWILRGLSRARRMVCVSQKTRQDFQALLPKGPSMTVISNPLNGNFRPAGDGEIASVREMCKLNDEDEYLLHVGGDQWYKNRPGALRIMAELRKSPRFVRVKLVFAGSPLSSDLRQKAEELGEVIEYVWPSDEHLRALYSGALALLFPSLEEGFGWPVVEAQACGCPVITSARSPMKEVSGGAAILIDPEDTETAAATIVARIREIAWLREAGLANVRNYSLDTAIEHYQNVYREIVPEPPRDFRKRGS